MIINIQILNVAVTKKCEVIFDIYQTPDLIFWNKFKAYFSIVKVSQYVNVSSLMSLKMRYQPEWVFYVATDEDQFPTTEMARKHGDW